VRFDPVLCDFDGTIADSEPVIVSALQAACADLGFEAPPAGVLARCVGPPLERTLPGVLGERAPIQDIIRSYRRHYMAVATTATPLMPGAREALTEFDAEGVQIGIVTNKPLPLIESILEGLSLSPLIDAVSAPALDAPATSKSLLLRSALTDLSPRSSLPIYIGDHDEDEQAAHQVGIRFLRFPESTWAEIRAEVLGP